MRSRLNACLIAGILLATTSVPSVHAEHTGKEDPAPRGPGFERTLCTPYLNEDATAGTVCATGEVYHSSPNCARTTTDGYHCDVTFQYRIHWEAGPLPATVHVNGTTNVTTQETETSSPADVSGTSTPPPNTYTYTDIPQDGKTVNVTAWLCIKHGTEEAYVYQRCERWLTDPIPLPGEGAASGGVEGVLGLASLAGRTVEETAQGDLVPVGLDPELGTPDPKQTCDRVRELVFEPADEDCISLQSSDEEG